VASGSSVPSPGDVVGIDGVPVGAVGRGVGKSGSELVPHPGQVAMPSTVLLQPASAAPTTSRPAAATAALRR